MPTIEQLNISRKSSVMADELAYITKNLPEELKIEAMRIVADLNKLSFKLANEEPLELD